MADGDYERGRGHEISAIAAELKRLAADRARRVSNSAGSPQVFVLNGWAASPHAWDLCKFMKVHGDMSAPRLFSYVDQLDGLPEKALEGVSKVVVVGWSMGGSSALRLAARFPAKIAGLVLVAATPRMMEEKETGWRGMSPRRLEALRYGLVLTRGEGFFGVPDGKPNPYLVDDPGNLERGLKYLLETDVRGELRDAWSVMRGHEPQMPPVHIFQSEKDGIVRMENAEWLKEVFPGAVVAMVPGGEHALPIMIPEQIDAAVFGCLRSTSGCDRG